MSAPYEIVCADSDPEWLARRRELVTGSVAPQLLGTSRFGSLLGTYLRMREGADPEEISDDRRQIMDWGTDQQDAIVQNIRRRLGLRAERTGALLRSTAYPWIGCTLDGWVENPGFGRAENPESLADLDVPFEVKTTRSRTAAEDWEEGIPDYVVPQVQTQLLVTGAPRALVAAVVFGAPPAFAWLERNEEMIGQIVETSKDLWDRVQRGDPPEPDGSREATDALEKLVSREPGRVVELDIEAVVLAEDLAALQETKKDLDRRIREHQQKIIRKLGDAEEGLLPGGGRMTYRETVRRGFLRVDWPHAADVVAALPAGTKVSESKESRFRVLRRSKK
jgi:predicted phage-related endonuclease